MLNKCTFIGNTGADPEVRYTQDNKPIANLSLGCTESWKDKNGERQEKTEWVRVVVFGGLAGVVEKYVKKGHKLYIEGKLQTRKWQDNEGNDRYSTEVVVDGFGGNMIMLGGKAESTQATPAAEPVTDEVPF